MIRPLRVTLRAAVLALAGILCVLPAGACTDPARESSLPLPPAEPVPGMQSPYRGQVLNLGYVDSPPYAMERSGEATGYLTELISRATHRLGATLSLRALSPEEAGDALRGGTVDLLVDPLRGTDPDLHGSSRTLDLQTAILARPDRRDLRDLASLSGRRVAVHGGTALWRQLLPEGTGIEPMWVDDRRDALNAVSEGRAEAALMESRLARTLLVEHLIPGVVETGVAAWGGRRWIPASYFLVTREQSDLAQTLDRAIDALGPAEMQRLWRRWFAADDPALSLRGTVELTAAEQTFLDGLGDVVLGVDQDWTPRVIRNADGSLSGIDVDTLALVNSVLGTRIRLLPGRWSDLVARAERREIDGLASSSPHPERAPHFLFTRPYSETGKRVYVRAGNPLDLRSPADLAGKRVGYLDGNLYDRKALDGMPGVIPMARGRQVDLINGLLSGELDAAFAGDSLGPFLAARGITAIEPAFVHDETLSLVFSIRRDWPLLASAMDKVLAAIPYDERLAIQRRYLAAAVVRPAAGPALTAAEKDWLRARGGRLTYCYNPHWPPYDYADNGAHRGIFRDFLDHFARHLGVELVPVQTANWSEALAYARARRCDLVSGAVRLPQREEYLAFTRPYLELTQVLVGKAGRPFVAGIE